MSPIGRFCDGEECTNLAAKGGFCWACIKRRQRSTRKRGPPRRARDLVQQFFDAVHAYADAPVDDDREYNLRRKRLLRFLGHDTKTGK